MNFGFRQSVNQLARSLEAEQRRTTEPVIQPV
jgi:hypothetical protein